MLQTFMSVKISHIQPIRLCFRINNWKRQETTTRDSGTGEFHLDKTLNVLTDEHRNNQIACTILHLNPSSNNIKYNR